METKIQKEFIDKGFGFPVRLMNVPMVKVRGVWTPRINYNQLAQAVLHSLAFKSSRLTGAEVRFIRNHFEMTLQEFAKRFCVTHVAVLKWEKAKEHATSMNWSTEKDIRLFVLSKLQVKALVIVQLYSALDSVPETKPAEKSPPLRVDLERWAA